MINTKFRDSSFINKKTLLINKINQFKLLKKCDYLNNLIKKDI